MELDKNFKFRLQKVLDLKVKDEEDIKMEFAKMAGISQNTMARLSRNQNVSLDVLGKICCTLDCKIDDILEFISEDKEK